MNKVMKRVITACLAFAMILALITPASVEAASTKKITLYVGEAYSMRCSDFYKVTSISNSKGSYAKVTPHKSDRKFDITAKSAGNTVVTVKGKNYRNKALTEKLSVTVVKQNFSITAQKIDAGNVLFTLKNNTKTTFDRISAVYTLKDSTGAVASSQEVKFYNVISGKVNYSSVYVGRDADIDCSQAEFKITGLSRDLNYNYKTAGDKEVTVEKINETEDDRYIKFKLRETSKLNNYVYGHVYIISYDASGNITNVDSRSLSLGKKEVRTTSEYTLYKSSTLYPNFDHYEIVTQAYSMTRKK